jgi:hypothetical protein
MQSLTRLLAEPDRNGEGVMVGVNRIKSYRREQPWDSRGAASLPIQDNDDDCLVLMETTDGLLNSG